MVAAPVTLPVSSVSQRKSYSKENKYPEKSTEGIIGMIFALLSEFSDVHY